MAAGDVKLVYSTATDLLVDNTSFDALYSGGAGLTTGQFTTSSVIDNSSTLYQDLAVFVQIYTNSASATGPIHVYAAESVAGSDEYEDGLTANQTPGTATAFIANAHHLGSLYANTQTGYYATGTVRVGPKYGGRCPRKLLIALRNDTSQTVSASSNHQIEWRGIYSNVATS